MDSSVLPAFFGGTDFDKKLIVCEFSPYMIRFQIIEHDPVAVNRFLIQIIYQEVFQEQRILWRICLIAKHSFYFQTYSSFANTFGGAIMDSYAS